MKEGIGFVLPKLGLIAIGTLVLIGRKRIARESSAGLKRDSRSQFGSFTYTEGYFLALATGGGIFVITIGIIGLLPLFDTTPDHLGGSVVDFIRVYLVVPIIGGEFLVTFAYAIWHSKDEERKGPN